MHRTHFVPRSLWWSFLVGCALHVAALEAPGQTPDVTRLPGTISPAQPFGQPFTQPVFNKPGFAAPLNQPALQVVAQPPILPKEGAPNEPGLMIIPSGETRVVEMSTKAIIAEIRTDNPKVARVQADPQDPRRVLVTASGTGSTRVYLVDQKKNQEVIEVRVLPDDAVQREALRRQLLEEIRKAVPTANIDVLALPGNTVVLKGVVTNAESVQTIMDATRAVFGQAVVISNDMRIGGVQQVQLQVTVAVVNRSELRNIDFNFFINRNNFFVNSFLSPPVGAANTILTAIAGGSASGTLTGTGNLSFGVVKDGSGIAGFLQALRTENLGKIMTEPTVTTLSGRPAYIVSGGETPILTSSGQGAPSVSYRQFGTVVNFLPIVLGNGKIHLEVRPELSAINQANGISIPGVTPTLIPGFDTRSAQVAVQMEDGQTLAIGGLIQRTTTGNATKVPVVGDLPILGVLFSKKSFNEIEEEMIILVTPRLVDPLACCQLPKYLPGQETRSPDDFELFLEGILEAPRGQRQHCVDGRYMAAYHNGPTAGMYPCGDASTGPFAHMHGRLNGHGQCSTCGTGCSTGACNSCNGGSCSAPVSGHVRPVSNDSVEMLYPHDVPAHGMPIIREMP